MRRGARDKQKALSVNRTGCRASEFLALWIETAIRFMSEVSDYTKLYLSKYPQVSWTRIFRKFPCSFSYSQEVAFQICLKLVRSSSYPKTHLISGFIFSAHLFLGLPLCFLRHVIFSRIFLYSLKNNQTFPCNKKVCYLNSGTVI